MVHLTVGAALQAEEPFDPPSDQCAVETALCSSNTVELFALSSRRSILHARQLNCTTFTEWEDLGGAFAGGPTAVKNARGQLEVFARGVDKHLYRRVSSGDCCAFDAAKWECLGGCFSSKPHALLSSQGMVHVFARGCDRSVWQLQQTRDDVGELVWGEWQSLGGVVSSAPVAGVDAEGLIHVFARGITRALVSTAQRWNLSAVVWEPWAALGGALASGPRLDGVNAGSNLLEVYARGADKALWRKRQQANVTVDDVGRRMGVRWGHWESLGGVFASGVSTATTADLLPQVFARSTDRALWQKKQVYRAGSGDPAWTSWESLHGTLTSAPSVIALPELQGEVPLAIPPRPRPIRRRPPRRPAPPIRPPLTHSALPPLLSAPRVRPRDGRRDLAQAAAPRAQRIALVERLGVDRRRHASVHVLTRARMCVVMTRFSRRRQLL